MKAAPEGVAMREIEPETAPRISFYIEHVEEFGRISDALLFPRFSTYCLDELRRILKKNEAAELIEAVVRMGNYTDDIELSSRRKAVSELLRVNHGIRPKVGKRPRTGVVALVSQIAPILLYYGLLFRTNELSPLVAALRIIAEEIGLRGDPRDELRRLKKVDFINARAVRSACFSAFAEGLKPTKIHLCKNY
jgi:hypothetical protein